MGLASERRQWRTSQKGAITPTRPSAPLTACGAVWQQVKSQNGSWNNFLGGISAVTPLDMWAVGSSENLPTQFGNGDQNLAEHWDGRFWSVVPVPQPGPDANDLNNVAAIASNDVWAVGGFNTTGFVQAAAYHWNGTTWNSNALTPQSSSTVLNDVAFTASNDVWAVGRIMNNSNIRQTLIEHWNGSAWSIIPSPNFPGSTGDNDLFGVAADAANDAWAVGYYKATPTSARQSLILHYTGSPTPSWQVSSGPSYTGTLESVAAGSTTSAWAVGYSTSISNGLPYGVAASWNGTNWTDVQFSEPSVYWEDVTSVVAVSATNYWAVGFDPGNSSANGADQPFAMQTSGSTWALTQSPVTATTGPNDFYGVAAPGSGSVVWAVGAYINPSNLAQTLAESYQGFAAAPTNVTAVAGDQSAQVSWTASTCNGTSAITAYDIFAYDGCTLQGVQTASGSATTAAFNGLTNGTAFTFRVASVNSSGDGQQSFASAPVIPSGATSPSWMTACSPKQYTLAGSSGSSWNDIDAANLSVTFTPSVDSYLVLSGNADLWTDTAGYNQDIGLYVRGGVYPSAAGQPEAWKESGGFAGTYSPNAAYVQTVIPVKASTLYTAKLQWKSNRPDPGTIFAGAGPLLVGDCVCPPSPQSAGFSPTRLTAMLIPTASANVFTKSSTQQYTFTGSDGATWKDIDGTNLDVGFSVPATGTWMAYVSGNSDLWTSSAGYNQDIGITMSGPGFPTTAAQPEAWKESGGFAGTFSPNAAFVQVPLAVTAGTAYTARLQWKANKSDPGSIWAGAGPIGGKFSPTAVTVLLVPAANSMTGTSRSQYTQVDSDGGYWQPVGSGLPVNIAPSTATSYLLTANADLWTSVAGYNQDLGIMVSGGVYGGGTLVAWKESGGFAGTYSPNAAFVSTAVHLQPSTTYTVWLVWKANRIATMTNAIWIGAGPIPTGYSPTWLTATQLS